jgi:hypothetical protein
MIQKIIEKLAWLQFNFNIIISDEIFGEDMGEHLYNKFESYDNNIITFYNSLDNSNKEKFMKVFE